MFQRRKYWSTSGGISDEPSGGIGVGLVKEPEGGIGGGVEGTTMDLATSLTELWSSYDLHRLEGRSP